MRKKSLVVSLFIASLWGCGGGDSASSLAPDWLPEQAPSQLNQTQTLDLVQRATSGYSSKQVAQITQQGYINWLNHQFTQPAELHLNRYQQTLEKTQTIVPQEGCKVVRYEPNSVREGIWWQQLLYSDNQLRQRTAYALSQLLVVSKKYSHINRYPQSLVAYYDILQTHAFGNYRDLLEAVTLSPAMGAYLSMANSKKHNPKRGTYPDENYAREVMQLFTIGLYELNLDGSAKLDGKGNPIMTYQQQDVEAVARAFSGWTHARVNVDPNDPSITERDYINPMIPGADKSGSWHDEGEKTILGTQLPAGQTPLKDLQDVLDILFNHDNTPPFVARHLIQRLVTSNPSPQYIERVAQVFIDNGAGQRGDLKHVVAAILLDPEALDGSMDPIRYPMMKMKEPVLAIAEVFRILEAKVYGDLNIVLDSMEVFNAITQGPLTANSVFNFYSPDFMPSGPLLDQQLYAPEFEILPWANFVMYHNVLRARFQRVFQTDSTRCDHGIYLNLTPYFTAAADDEDKQALPDLIEQRFFAGKMSEELRHAIIVGTENERSPQNKAALALSLVVTSPEFLIQR